MDREIQVDSAGSRASLHKQPVDPRVKTVLAKRGYAVGKRKSRRVTEQDFYRYDLILVMDRENLHDLMQICPAGQAHKLHLFLEFARGVSLDEVPDPYFGSIQGFDRVLDLCEAGARGWLEHLQSTPA